MHRTHSAALWYFSPAIFFFSVSLLPETRILEVSRCLKAFCGLWQQQLMEICWVGALKCCSCLRGARPQLWVSLLGRWSNGGRGLIDFLPPSLHYSLSWYHFYATLSYNTFCVILTVAFSDPQSCPACKPSKAITSSVGQKMMKIPSAPLHGGNRIRLHNFSPLLQDLLSHRRKWRAVSWP